MNRRRWAWFMASVMLTAAAVLSSPAFATAQDTVPSGKQEQDAERRGESMVETILKEQEQLLSGNRFSYEPGGRRDPFRSLFQSSSVERQTRPDGVKGMLVNEIDLAGIVGDERSGDVAMVTGTDSKGYFLRVGDSVFDGTVIAVDPAAGIVTFRQRVDDPKIIKPFRDVIKRLRPFGDEE